MDVHYVDTSAVVKLIRTEPESAALVVWLSARRWVVSDLHRTELRRAARRTGPVTAARAERLLAHLEIIALEGSAFDTAGRLEPPELRSLDAIHLTCALVLDADLAGIVAYDERLLDAARQTRIPTASPQS